MPAGAPACLRRRLPRRTTAAPSSNVPPAPLPCLQLPPSSPRSPKRVQEDWLEGIEHPGLRRVLEAVKERDPQQPEFLAAVKEVAASIQVRAAWQAFPVHT